MLQKRTLGSFQGGSAISLLLIAGMLSDVKVSILHAVCLKKSGCKCPLTQPDVKVIIYHAVCFQQSGCKCPLTLPDVKVSISHAVCLQQTGCKCPLTLPDVKVSISHASNRASVIVHSYGWL